LQLGAFLPGTVGAMNVQASPEVPRSRVIDPVWLLHPLPCRWPIPVLPRSVSLCCRPLPCSRGH